MKSVSHLSTSRAFMAYIENEHLLLAFADDAVEEQLFSVNGHASTVQVGVGESSWGLWADPPPGITLQPQWSAQMSMPALVAREKDAGKWLLAKTLTEEPLHVGGNVNLYGGKEAVVAWLEAMVAHTLSAQSGRLVVIDGSGDLVARLKRQEAITRHLGQGLVYINMEGPPLYGGFNPLAAVPGEDEAQTLARWQRWFAGMNVGEDGLRVIKEAYGAGTRDFPGLQQWLVSSERGHLVEKTARIQYGMNRLLTDPSLRQWLEWPTDAFATMPAGCLLFACPGTSWARQQILRAAILSALAMPDVRLVLHGIPWQELDFADLAAHPRLLVSNGPRQPDSTVVLVKTEKQGASILAERFLGDDLALKENLQLLQMGEGVIVQGEAGIPVTWHNDVPWREGN